MKIGQKDILIACGHFPYPLLSLLPRISSFAMVRVMIMEGEREQRRREWRNHHFSLLSILHSMNPLFLSSSREKCALVKVSSSSLNTLNHCTVSPPLPSQGEWLRKRSLFRYSLHSPQVSERGKCTCCRSLRAHLPPASFL